MTREYLFMMTSFELDIADEAKERAPIGALANADLRSICMRGMSVWLEKGLLRLGESNPSPDF